METIEELEKKQIMTHLITNLTALLIQESRDENGVPFKVLNDELTNQVNVKIKKYLDLL